MKFKSGDNRIYIWMDWGSSPFWIPMEKDSIHLGNYQALEKDLPKDLAERFDIWAKWFDNQKPEMSDEYNKHDQDLYKSYGKALACDLKKLFPELRVFFGHITSEDLIEIELVERNIEYKDIVCISKKIKPINYSELGTNK